MLLINRIRNIRRLCRLAPQLGFVGRILFAVTEMIGYKLRKYGLKDSYGGYSALNPYNPYLPCSINGKRMYETLICVSGSGYSGSGAILDLLEEYDDLTALHFCDLDSGRGSGGVEFDLLRQFGGLFWLEEIFDRKHFEPMTNGAVLLFLNLVEYLHVKVGSIFNASFIEATRHFLDKLILARFPTGCEPDTPGWSRTFVHCNNLRIFGNGGAKLLWGDEGCAFVLKALSVEEYRAIAREYIDEFLCSINCKRFLVLDQAVSDYSYDFKKYRDYLGMGVKYVFSIRDPRDVYVTGRQLNEKWVPSDPVAFVQWFADGRGVGRCIKVNDPEALVVRFEDLVLHYDATVERIEKHIGLNPSMHVKRCQYFSPHESRKNVGSYKDFPDSAAITYIGEKLSDLCYDL